MFSRKHSEKSVITVSTLDSSKNSSTHSGKHAGTMTPTDSLTTPDMVKTPSSMSVNSVSSFTSTVGGYSRSQALADLPGIRDVLDLFLSGHMVDAEKACIDADPKGERLYTSTGIGIIQALKGFMSYEDSDIMAALESVKHATQIANSHRRPPSSLASRVAGLVVGGAASGIGLIRAMTPVERHAELTYAECLLQQAMLGIVSSGDWLTFIKEFLNIRSATNIYRTLGQFIQAVDAEAVARGEGPIDKSVDADFRSGVSLGTGINHITLTLLPDTVSSVVALFGYKGDRMEGLAQLAKPGGWTSDSEEPTIPRESQGLRRPITDLSLLTFHLFISGFTHTGVDVAQARKVLNYNLKLYPEGVFFLFLEGRLRIIEGRPQEAIKSYQRGLGVTEYKSLKGIAEWEIAVAQLSLCDFNESFQHFTTLQEESNWSKAIYAYGAAASKVQLGDEQSIGVAAALLAKVPNLLRRVAGKSIPAEKFVARKSRKFENQGNRLLLPGLEIGYVFGALQHTPPDLLIARTLPLIENAMRATDACSADPKTYGNGKGYWDDYALGRFLHGVCMRLIAYPDPETIIDPSQVHSITKADAEARAFESFKKVLEHGPQIELDHHLVYFTHYELGKLYARSGDKAEAKRRFELVNSGKTLEVNPQSRKGGKYSLENALHVRCHAALDALEHDRGL